MPVRDFRTFKVSINKNKRKKEKSNVKITSEIGREYLQDYVGIDIKKGPHGGPKKYATYQCMNVQTGMTERMINIFGQFIEFELLRLQHTTKYQLKVKEDWIKYGKLPKGPDTQAIQNKFDEEYPPYPMGFKFKNRCNT